jgi:hypothetical protein
MRLFAWVSFLFASVALTCQASSTIPTKIISGGEVSITEVNASSDGENITVSGIGFAIFPHQTCGHVEVALVNASGQILARKVAEYDTSGWYNDSPRKSSNHNRLVSFSLEIPMAEAAASILVRHQSTGGCEHSWSLQHTWDWLVDKFFPGKGS